MNITIRKAVEADAERIHELHLNSVRTLCGAVYSKEILDGWLGKRTPWGYLEGIRAGQMYVAELKGKIIGFGHAVPGEIAATFVDPAYARQGVGKALLTHGLEMVKVNTPGAIRLEATLNSLFFFEAMGFTVTREMAVRRGSVDVPCYEMVLDANTSKIVL